MQATISLKDRYTQLKAEQPRLRIRDAARYLQVSELELLELQLGGNVRRLEGDWKDVLKDVHKLGHVMALTRNEYAVHERKGVYENVSFMKDGRMGVAVNPDIDLRFFMWEWKYGYAVTLESPKRTLKALQFFNARGEAVHKIYLTPKSKQEAYEELVNAYLAEDQHSLTQVDHSPVAPTKHVPDAEVDVEAFQEAWLNLQDTHDFFPLLKKYELQRQQALRLAPEGHAYQVSKEAIVQMFEKAQERQLPIMVFLNSAGCIQIHTGPVKKLVPMNGWFNVMDPEFNLHLQLEGIDQVWVVKKPTKDGMVTGMEVFDATGKLIIYCFGKRKPGIPELSEWRSLVDELN